MEQTKMPLRKSPTQIFVGALIGVALLIVAFKVAGLWGGLFLSALLAWESWTLVNKYPHDTISEIIWGFADRPMVPFIFGAGFSWGIESKFLASPWLIASLGFLMGHFFFQRKGK